MNSNVFDINEDTPQLIRFKMLEDISFINHCFSTRLGGVSDGIYKSLNLGFDRGDEKENVLVNFHIICDKMGVDINSTVHSAQVHDDKIYVVDLEDKGKGIIRESDIIGYDGLITNIEGVTLVRSFADCVPLYFIDIKNKAIGLTHSGWKGTVKKIGQKTLEAMKVNFGTNPSDVIAAIGPSICQDCYEVSQDVINEFRLNFRFEEMNKIAIAKDNDKYQLNLQEANKIILENAGIKSENIAITDLCTSCNNDFFHSHRASKGQRGGLVAMLAIKE
jgi:YfiH family protein